jgi:hypothetical protein
MIISIVSSQRVECDIYFESPIFEESQVDQFMRDGYLVIKKAFTKKKAAEWTKDLWIRLGMESNDKRTWTQEKVHMPTHKSESVKTFAPKV